MGTTRKPKTVGTKCGPEVSQIKGCYKEGAFEGMIKGFNILGIRGISDNGLKIKKDEGVNPQLGSEE